MLTKRADIMGRLVNHRLTAGTCGRGRQAWRAGQRNDHVNGP
jgi:hypothetical protein